MSATDRVTKEIRDGAARAFFVSAWAQEQEEKESRGEKFESPGAGGDWMHIAPKKTPLAAVASANRLLNGVKKQMGFSAADYFRIYGAGEDPEKFGHYLAMQAMGSGVSWWDDHDTPKFKVPYIEFYL